MLFLLFIFFYFFGLPSLDKFREKEVMVIRKKLPKITSPAITLCPVTNGGFGWTNYAKPNNERNTWSHDILEKKCQTASSIEECVDANTLSLKSVLTKIGSVGNPELWDEELDILFLGKCFTLNATSLELSLDFKLNEYLLRYSFMTQTTFFLP